MLDDGTPYISSKSLPNHGLAAKRHDQLIIVCNDSTCLSLDFTKDCIEKDNTLYIKKAALAQTFGPDLTGKGAMRSMPANTASAGSKEVAVGQIMPDFMLPDLQGKPVSLSSFRGKRVLLVCWASW